MTTAKMDGRDRVMTEEEMRKKFVADPSLVFINEYVYPNGSVYKGQMKDEDRHGFGV